MESMAWTDERLDDLSHRVEKGFESVDRRFDAVHADMREIRAEIGALRMTLIRVGGAMMAGLVGVIAAVLARGV